MWTGPYKNRAEEEDSLRRERKRGKVRSRTSETGTQAHESRFSEKENIRRRPGDLTLKGPVRKTKEEEGKGP